MRRPLRTLVGLIALTLLLAACSGNVFELAVGDCFDDGDLSLGELEEVGEVPLVECSEPHDNEVYAIVAVDGEVFPGEQAIQTRADESCLDAFDPFVGLDYESSALDFGWLVPTADSWELGDRVVACFVYRLDLEKVSGTLQGSSI
ncbi:MAG: septum formation family protein [Acidimicrobiia bacterium]